MSTIPEKAPAKAAGEKQGASNMVQMALPYVQKISEALQTAAPYMQLARVKCTEAWTIIEPYHPLDIAKIMYGVLMAFFGGFFPMLIMSVEAYRQVGFGPTVDALCQIWSQVQVVQEKFKEDDAIDADGDGIADVKQIENKQLVQRKAKLLLRVIDPETMSMAFQSISTGVLAVLATLRTNVAAAITLGAAIGDVCLPPALRVTKPVLKKLLDEDHHKWIVPGITYVIKGVCVSVAWTVTSITFALHSASRGGQMAGQGLINYLHKINMINFDSNESLLDETVGYGLMALGLVFQFGAGLSLPFPFSVIFFPFTLLEYIIMWIVME